MTWHVKGSLPLLVDRIEDRVHHHLKHKVLETKGAIFHEVGGTETHVHLVATVPPTIKPSEWIGILKGSSSHHINHEIANRHLLDWQDGYGVVSFGTKDLAWVKRYVRNQKEHHARGTTYERLERIEWLKPEEE